MFSSKLLAPIGAGVLALGLTFAASTASAQSLQPGDQLISLSFVGLEREDMGTERNATSTILSYTYQQNSRLSFTGMIGRSSTEGIFPPTPADRQETSNPLIGAGLGYLLAPGRLLSASLLYGDISEEYSSGGFTSRGDGNTLTASLRISQSVPLSARLFLNGALSGSVSWSEFETPGINNSPTTVRYDGSLSLTYLVTPDLALSAGIHRALANNIITITGQSDLTRGELGLSYRFSENTGIRLSYMQGIGAEDTHQRLRLTLMQRF